MPGEPDLAAGAGAGEAVQLLTEGAVTPYGLLLEAAETAAVAEAVQCLHDEFGAEGTVQLALEIRCADEESAAAELGERVGPVAVASKGRQEDVCLARVTQTGDAGPTPHIRQTRHAGRTPLVAQPGEVMADVGHAAHVDDVGMAQPACVREHSHHRRIARPLDEHRGACGGGCRVHAPNIPSPRPRRRRNCPAPDGQRNWR